MGALDHAKTRYLIDGAQVEEEEFEEPTEEDLRSLIEASKYGVSEAVSELAYSREPELTSFKNLSIKTRASKYAALDMMRRAVAGPEADLQDVERELRERGLKKD